MRINTNGQGGERIALSEGVQVTTHTARHARAAMLSAPTVKACEFHSLVDGHLGYNCVFYWEWGGMGVRREEEKQQG